jgi:hypothetical protein
MEAKAEWKRVTPELHRIAGIVAMVMALDLVVREANQMGAIVFDWIDVG